MLGMYKSAIVLPVLMNVCTILFHDKSSVYYYFGFSELHINAASSARSIFETFPTSSDDTYDVGNMKFDIHIKEEEEEEEEEVNVKTEKVIVSEEGICIDIKCEESLHIEEVEEKEEDMDIRAEEDIAIKEKVKVRMRIHCNIV